MDERHERQRRLDRARAQRHGLLVLGVALIVLTAFLYVAAPGFPGGRMFASEVMAMLDTLVPLAGIGGAIGGLIWMIRIHRADPEAGERTWRYRDF
jgi:hypothetical protein